MPESVTTVVLDEEKVARVIFSPSYIYKGRVAPTAFRWEVLPSGDIKNNPVFENSIGIDVLPFPSKRLPNHAGIVVDINNSRVTANTPVTPELMFIQKMLASICSDIIRF